MGKRGGKEKWKVKNEKPKIKIKNQKPIYGKRFAVYGIRFTILL
jgi:hypothetical protein